MSRRRLLQTAGAAVTAAFVAEFLPPNVRRALAAGPSTVQHSAWDGGKMDNWLPAHLAADAVGAAVGGLVMVGFR